MIKHKTIIQYFNYSPTLYNSFDKYNIEVAKKMAEYGYKTIFIFKENIKVEELTTELKNANIDVVFTKRANYSLLGKVIFFIRLLKTTKPQIIHIQFGPIEKIAFSIINKFWGGEFYASFHSLLCADSKRYEHDKGILKYLLLKLYLKNLCLLSRNVLCVSDGIKNQLIDFIGNNKKLKTLYLGVDFPDNVTTELNLRSDDKEVIFCNVSAIEKIKGIETIIDALSILKLEKETLPPFKFYHMGGLRTDSEAQIKYQNWLKQKVHDAGLDERFIWLGQRSDVGALLKQCNFYIHPSLMEGLPLSIMEAGYYGLPTIGTNVGGIPEIVISGKTGILIEKESAKELAEAILVFIKKPDILTRYSQGIKEVVKNNFTLNKQAKKCVIYMKNKKLLILNKVPFGKLTDSYMWCKNLKGKFEITFLCFDTEQSKMNMDGVEIKYVSYSGTRLVRGLRFLLISLWYYFTFNGLILVVYFEKSSWLKKLIF